MPWQRQGSGGCGVWLLLTVLCVASSGARAQAGRDAAKASALEGRSQPVDAAQELARARDHFEKGRRAYEQGDLGAALSSFRQANALRPSHELRYNIARVLERMGNRQGAVAAYRAYLAGRPSDDRQAATVRVRMAELEAVVRAEQLQDLKPAPSPQALQQEARTFFKRGVRLYRRGDNKAALSAFRAAYQFAPLAATHFNMALVCRQMGRKRDAVDHFRAYLRKRPDAPDRAQVEALIQGLRAP